MCSLRSTSIHRNGSYSSANPDKNISGEDVYESDKNNTMGLTNLANSPPPVSPSTASPSGVPSFRSFEGAQPFWEPDYPSQRFRPDESTADVSDDGCYTPPSQLFSPPVSPNRIENQHTSFGSASSAGLSINSVVRKAPRPCSRESLNLRSQDMASPPKDVNERKKTTSFTPVYKGFTFTPRANLTAYGTFADRSRLQDASFGGVYTLMSPGGGASQAAEQPDTDDTGRPIPTNAVARRSSQQTLGEESHFSSEVEIHQCAGVPLYASDEIPTMNEHQAKSFEELETERGIIEWNNTVFDERWLDPPSPNLAKTPNDQQPTTPRKVTSRGDHASFLHDLESTSEKMDLSARFRPDPSIWGARDKSTQPVKSLTEKQAQQEPLSGPPWPDSLQDIVRDLKGGTGELPHAITHRPAVLRRYFYDRVFPEEWEWLASGEQKMTECGGRICSVGAVRDQVLRDIENLISLMRAPVGQGTRREAFPRNLEAAAIMDASPSGGKVAVPEDEQSSPLSRRIGKRADIATLSGHIRRDDPFVDGIGTQSGSHANAGLEVSSRFQSPESTTLAQHTHYPRFAVAETGTPDSRDWDITKKQAAWSNSDSPSHSSGMLTSRDRKTNLSIIPADNENTGANGSEGRHYSEYLPFGHNSDHDTTPANTRNRLPREQQANLLHAAGENFSLSQGNRSSSQETLTANSNDNMVSKPFHTPDDQYKDPDAQIESYAQSYGLSHVDWDSYVPPPPVMEPVDIPPSGPPPSRMHPAFARRLSEAAPQQPAYAEYEHSDQSRAQHHPRHAPWDEAYNRQPTRSSPQPSRSHDQRFGYPGPGQMSHNATPHTPYATPQYMQYGTQSMQHGFSQQAATYAGSSTTDTGSNSAYEGPMSRYTYITPGVRAPAPNRVAAILARTRGIEWGIPAAETPHHGQAYRQHGGRGAHASAHAFAQDQAGGFPMPGHPYLQTQYGGVPQAFMQPQIRGTLIPPQTSIPNRVRGTPGPDENYIRNQFGGPPPASQILPQYPIYGPSAPYQSFGDGNIRSARTPTQALQNAHEWQSRFGIPLDMVKPDLPILHYRDGSDDMCPQSTKGVPSVAYQNLVRNLNNNHETIKATEHTPFAETARNTKPVEWGVLKIGNIPYDISKDLVISFLGVHAKLITANLGPAIHIIMDRVSGKTMDCFVEFLSSPDARATCNSINLRQRGLIRISDRVVDVTMSSQNDLLSTLFPKAKDVKWVNGKPIVMQPEEEWSSGFKSFVSAEELGLLVRHAEQPHRSNYTQRSPQRCYESMISLLSKFPWHSVENYTVLQRDQIFNATRQMLHILSTNIRKQYSRGNHSRAGSSMSYTSAVSGSSDRYHSGGPTAYGSGVNINPGSKSAEALTEDLLKDLLSAGLNAAGFSENQRWQLYETCEFAKHHFIISPMLQHWPFEVLGRKVRVEEDVLEFYAQIIACHPNIEPTGLPFGSLSKMLSELDRESKTMDQVGSTEMGMLNELLPRGFERFLSKLQMEGGMAAMTL